MSNRAKGGAHENGQWYNTTIASKDKRKVSVKVSVRKGKEWQVKRKNILNSKRPTDPEAM